MGHRLSAITTRTGDDGTSGLADGTRLPKDHARFHAMGDVDELNSQLGLLRAQLKAGLSAPQALAAHAAEMQAVDEALRQVQNDLFNLGGQISCPGMTLLMPERLQQLDDWVARDNADLPRLTEFILPGGSLAAAQCHIARTLARRAERS
ncbi:MAG: cob(I)yrinic acid a,c-diamide adenosyltransferase, partial [Burkholderiaceae bacterium]